MVISQMNIDLIFSIDYKLGKFTIKPRVELRYKDSEQTYRFRNKLSFTQKIYKKINFYVSDEIFIKDEINANRIYSGIMLKTERVDFMVYYLL